MYVVPLSQLKLKDAKLCGAKAASLAKLYASHAHVPETFVLTDEARKAFFALNQLAPVIQAELDRLQVEELHSIDYASRVIEDAILAGTFPSALETELLQQYAHTNAASAVVRSSAFAPQGLPDAWGAELRTEINVHVDSLLEAIKRCWASAFSARSLYLAASHHVNLAEIRHSLIVQRMIPALASGLVYTIHPVHRDPNLLVIEAGLGLGEAIEHGHVIPDTYTLTKEPLKILEKHVVAQASRLMPQATGEGTTVEALDPIETQKLSDREIFALAQRAIDMETLFKTPLCLEWAWDDDVYLLQARDIRPGV